MQTLPNRLRQAAQYTLTDAMEKLLLEAAGALESANHAAEFERGRREGITQVYDSMQRAEGAAKPVWLIATGETFGGQETYTRHDQLPMLCDAEKLYTAPQPPERKPLTEWQIVDLMREWKDGETIADLIRLVEARHGIKD